ncbi:hypothetical protein KC207_04480 [Phycicoccus sp. BSK3Z-2]|uniref:Uncharacterized protein n=1 Tax=Phycicoccus avicenniae TaxID=2828860 RepID=A0A941D5L2_9MICO|nr:hypothetical protein [Phycicoccus avicenniae]MBR7742544.1 hypothetical protein [Phycicoccus avicenniae]
MTPSSVRRDRVRQAIAHTALALVLTVLTVVVALMPAKVEALVVAEPHGPVGREGWYLTGCAGLLALVSALSARAAWRRARGR